MALQLQSHGLFKVRPVEVSQHVEQVPADLLHQGLKGVGELFAWRGERGGETGLSTGEGKLRFVQLFYILSKKEIL